EWQGSNNLIIIHLHTNPFLTIYNMAKQDKCDWCGKQVDYYKAIGSRKGIIGTLASGNSGNVFCSNKCKAEYENNDSTTREANAASALEKEKMDLERQRYKMEKEK